MPTLVTHLGLTGDQVTFTQTNDPLVEPLGGNISLADIMKRFPVEVYHEGTNTRVYKFVQALCGDSGAGILKAQSLAVRLKNEGPLLIFHDLDTFYAHVFNFPRIRRELYNYDAAANALLDVSYDPANISVEKEIWDKIHAADSSYQKRVIDLMHATRLGNSPEGMRLAAKAGSGEECDVRENYKWIFDQLADEPLNLERLGETNSTSEFMIEPSSILNTNQTSEASNTLTLTFTGSPASGTFRLKYETAATSDITWTGSSIATEIFNAIIAISSGTLITLDDLTVTVDPSDLHVYTIVLTNGQLDALFFGVDDNSLNTGSLAFTYPLGDSYYMVDFDYPLASFQEDNIEEIQDSTTWDADNPTTDAAFYADNVALGPTVHLIPDIEYNMVQIVDRLRPVGTVMTVKPKRSAHIKSESRSVFGSSENFNLIRWVTGEPTVKWPPLDAGSGAFIQGIVTENGVTANVENEGTTFAFGTHVFPAIFQTMDSVSAYTNDALGDSLYNSPTFFTDRYIAYKSEHQGQFDVWVKTMFPFLQSISNNDLFGIGLAFPTEPAPLVANFPFILA